MLAERTHQEGCHPKHEHIDKVCCAKLERDLLERCTILDSAYTQEVECNILPVYR